MYAPKLVPLAGIGPATSPLPRECSTTEPQGRKLLTNTLGLMERETGIEPVSLAWKAKVLPLNYSRTDRAARVDAAPMLGNHFQLLKSIRRKPVCWWRRLDSNQCRRKPTDLQSAPFSHSGTPPEASLRLCHLFAGPCKIPCKFSPCDGFCTGFKQETIGTCEVVATQKRHGRA